MKTLVTYFSQSGNTKIIAKAIYEKLDAQKTLSTLNGPENLSEYDFVFIGFPIHKNGVPGKVKEFIKTSLSGKKIALFITHAMHPDSKMTQIVLDRCKNTVSNAKVIGLFHCQGELSEQIANVMLKNDDPKLQNFGRMRQMTIGHPNSLEINDAMSFAVTVVDKLREMKKR